MLKSRQQQEVQHDALDYQLGEGSGQLNGHEESLTGLSLRPELSRPPNSPLHIAENARMRSLGDDSGFLQDDFLQLPALDNNQAPFPDHLGLYSDAAEPSSSSYPRNVFDDMFEGLL